jgi:hypothetical protein
MIIGLPLVFLVGTVANGDPLPVNDAPRASDSVASESQEPRRVRPTVDDVTLPPTSARPEAHVETIRADEPVDPWGAWRTRRLTLEADLGIAAPLGGVGFYADYALATRLSVGCGVGTNFIGPEGACMARARLFERKRSAFYFGVGVSGGPHRQSDVSRLGLLAIPLAPLTQIREDLPPAPRDWDFAKWANFEIGFDTRWEKGGTMRAYLGIAALLNPGGSTTAPPDDKSYYGTVDTAKMLLYAGIGFGRAL